DLVSGLGTPRAAGVVAGLKNVSSSASSSAARTAVATARSTARAAARTASRRTDMPKALPDIPPATNLVIDHSFLLNNLSVASVAMGTPDGFAALADRAEAENVVMAYRSASPRVETYEFSPV